MTCTRQHNKAFSVIHLAIQLSYLLFLPGLFSTSPTWNSNFYTEQFRYSTDYISFYQCKRSACTLLGIFWCFRNLVFCFFSSASLQGSIMYMTVYTIQTHAFHLFTKGMVNDFLTRLPAPKNNLAAPWLDSRMPHSLWRKLSLFRFAAEKRTQSVV